MAPVIKVDLKASQRRIRRLRSYVEKNLLRDGKFVCPAYQECRESPPDHFDFREGTMSHVGKRFDLTLDGKPLRIVIVGQESGLPKDPKLAQRVTPEDRYRQTHDRSGLQRRYYSEPGYPGRNPHMRGTTSALRVVLGKGLGSDYEGEWIDPANGKPFHLFDGFALVNRLLCSAGPPQTSQGRPTSTMWRNCGDHFAATLSILEPTLVIAQGRGVSSRVQQILKPQDWQSGQLYRALWGQQEVAVCLFSHPSSQGVLRWGDRPDAPYLTEVVAPTLRQAVTLLGN